MRKNEWPASNTRAEAAMALKTLLIVLLSTLILPRALLVPFSETGGIPIGIGRHIGGSQYISSSPRISYTLPNCRRASYSTIAAALDRLRLRTCLPSIGMV